MGVEVKLDLAPFDAMTSAAHLADANEQLTEYVMQDVGSKGGGRGGYVPYDTGNLHDSAYVSGKDEFTYEADYADYVYNGTSRQAAQPWFEDAKSALEGEWAQKAAKLVIGG